MVEISCRTNFRRPTLLLSEESGCVLLGADMDVLDD
jgi:hypothetical protein